MAGQKKEIFPHSQTPVDQNWLRERVLVIGIMRKLLKRGLIVRVHGTIVLGKKNY